MGFDENDYAAQQPGIRRFRIWPSFTGSGKAAMAAGFGLADAESFAAFMFIPWDGAPHAMQVTDFAVITSPQQVQKAAMSLVLHLVLLKPSMKQQRERFALPPDFWGTTFLIPSGSNAVPCD